MVGDGIRGAVVVDGFGMGLGGCGDGVGGAVVWEGTGLVGRADGGGIRGEIGGSGICGVLGWRVSHCIVCLSFCLIDNK